MWYTYISTRSDIDEIIDHDNNIEIPNISTFVIKKQKLILRENYLKDYEKGITLK